MVWDWPVVGSHNHVPSTQSSRAPHGGRLDVFNHPAPVLSQLQVEAEGGHRGTEIHTDLDVEILVGWVGWVGSVG